MWEGDAGNYWVDGQSRRQAVWNNKMISFSVILRMVLKTCYTCKDNDHFAFP